MIDEKEEVPVEITPTPDPCFDNDPSTPCELDGEDSGEPNSGESILEEDYGESILEEE